MQTNVGAVLGITSTRVDTISIQGGYVSLTATAVFRIKDEGSNTGASQATRFINLVNAKDASLAANGFSNAKITTGTPSATNPDGIDTEETQVSGVASWMPAWFAVIVAILMAL